MSINKRNNRSSSSLYRIDPFYTILPALMFLIILSFVGCKSKGELDLQLDNPIEFDTLYTNQAYYINNDSTQPSCNLKLTFIYPKEYSDKAILDSIQHLFISDFIGETYKSTNAKEALMQYEADYIDSYKRDMEIFYGNTNVESEHENEDKYLSYYETIGNKIIFNKADLLSTQVSRTNYKGGANTYQFYSNYSIDLKTGTLLTEDDIFKPEYKDVLSSLFKENIIKQNKVKDLADLNNLGYFGLEEIAPNDNFLIEQTGITYTFNTGEYSAYKLDPIVINIPYNELKEIIKENSPISPLIENQ